MASLNIRSQMDGFRLATAEILYCLPDHPSLLQSYIWQDLDVAPKFPILCKFLRFWDDNLDGQLFHVTVGAKEIISAGEWMCADEFLIN